MSAAIDVADAGVRFDFDRAQRLVTPVLGRMRRRGTSVWGLRHASFRVEAGEGVALVGPSGSGKTSMLRVLAGIIPPDEGTVEVRGRIGSLLAVEAGLMGPLTGRENAETLAVLAGLPRAQARAELDAFAERSRLDEAFDRPVASYSEGMRARLGFAIAESSAPEVLLLDEVFEALDHRFRAIVEDHVRALCARGGIVIAAGHDHAALERICPRALVLGGGRVRADGPFAQVVPAYRAEA